MFANYPSNFSATLCFQLTEGDKRKIILVRKKNYYLQIPQAKLAHGAITVIYSKTNQKDGAT